MWTHEGKLNKINGTEQMDLPRKRVRGVATDRPFKALGHSEGRVFLGHLAGEPPSCCHRDRHSGGRCPSLLQRGSLIHIGLGLTGGSKWPSALHERSRCGGATVGRFPEEVVDRGECVSRLHE
jgi:hypothetical protein